MLPAQRRDVGQQRLVDRSPGPGHRVEGSTEIDRVPQHDRGGEERHSRRPVLLAFPASVPKTPEAMEANRAGECIPALAFVEFDSRISAQLRVFEPIKGEQGYARSVPFLATPVRGRSGGDRLRDV